MEYPHRFSEMLDVIFTELHVDQGYKDRLLKMITKAVTDTYGNDSLSHIWSKHSLSSVIRQTTGHALPLLQFVLDTLPKPPKFTSAANPKTWWAYLTHHAKALATSLSPNELEKQDHGLSYSDTWIWSVEELVPHLRLCHKTGNSVLLQEALGNAAELGCTEFVALLLKHAPSVDVNVQDSNGFTPLNTAAKTGHFRIVNLLLEAGADIELPNNHHLTPLQSAVGAKHAEIVQLLVDRGAAVFD
eukprot:TRINITY_DN113773_c0_g1_i1.p1 TRINITY_DN113773_c0_g1~~TRINITY_DN113773_c0_g1_i1.p1  ORF type:complete len:265 (+),score=16.73 TRINITY_DN113773_c0_g1_i1:66-797(+)